MKQYARNIDDLRRIVIPAEICRVNNIKPGDLMQIEVVSAGILLTPAKACCIICGSSDELVTVHDAALCRNCLNEAGEASGK